MLVAAKSDAALTDARSRARPPRLDRPAFVFDGRAELSILAPLGAEAWEWTLARAFALALSKAAAGSRSSASTKAGRTKPRASNSGTTAWRSSSSRRATRAPARLRARAFRRRRLSPEPFAEPPSASPRTARAPRIVAWGRLARTGTERLRPGARRRRRRSRARASPIPASMLLAAALMLGEGLGERAAQRTLSRRRSRRARRRRLDAGVAVRRDDAEFADVVLSQLPVAAANAEFYREAEHADERRRCACSARSRPRASRSSSDSPAARSSRPTTRSRAARPSATCSPATSRAPAHGRGLRARVRPRRRRDRDLGPGRDEPRHADRRRVDGLDAARLHHRAGALAPDRHRRLPGVRHHRDHDPDRQALVARAGRRGAAARDEGRLPRRPHGPLRARARRHPARRPGGRARLRVPGRRSTCPAGSRRSAGHPRQIREAAQATRGGREARPLRGRRRPQRRRLRGAPRARRGRAAARRHDADGARAPSRRRTSCTSAGPACTAPSGRTGR